VATWIGSLTSI